MRVLSVLVLQLGLVSTTLAATPSARPTHASLRKAYEQNAPSLVTVRHGKRAGPGIVVSADGHVLTSVEHVGLDEATVEIGESTHAAKVVAADAKLKIAVLQLPPDERTRWPAPAADTGALRRGTWLVGVLPARGKKKEQTPLAGQVRRTSDGKTPLLLTDLPLPVGSPLFDVRGRLVAVVVGRAGKIGSRALPIAAVQRLLASTQERGQ